MDSTNPYQSPQSEAPLDGRNSPQPLSKRASVLRDAGVILAFLVSLYFVGVVAFRVGGLIAPLLPRIVLPGMGVVNFLVASLLLHMIGNTAIGFLLARCLRRINPWHVWTGLLLIAVVYTVDHASQIDLEWVEAELGLSATAFFVKEFGGLVLILLSLALGIWYGRRPTVSRSTRGNGYEGDQPHV